MRRHHRCQVSGIVVSHQQVIDHEGVGRHVHALLDVGVLVDAKADAVQFYQRLGFIELEVVEGQSEARPIPTPLFLPIGDIRAAIK